MKSLSLILPVRQPDQPRFFQVLEGEWSSVNLFEQFGTLTGRHYTYHRQQTPLDPSPGGALVVSTRARLQRPPCRVKDPIRTAARRIVDGGQVHAQVLLILHQLLEQL